MPDFLLVTCQIGAESAVKQELARRWPKFRFAFSRPGFLTFKLPSEHGLAADFDLESVFARAYGFSLGAVRATGAGDVSNPSLAELAAATWKACDGTTVQRVHCWQRDRFAPGLHGYEPGLTDAAIEAHRTLIEYCPRPQSLAKDAADPIQPARLGDTVLDCVLLDDGHWWAGWHQVHSVPSRYPGGLMSLALPPDAVSRAWLKMEEGLRWSQLPMIQGARVAEIGSAPGGASQALLARGCWVLGIDPAAMAPAVAAHPRFTHLRLRSPQVRRREFRKIRWLTADMNVAPNYTLDAVEAIVTHPEVSIRGLLLTLKLPHWELSEQVPEYLDRIRGWGFNTVHARQLQYNRQEICVAALQKPFRRKPFLA
ncbi:MAG: SAM-dependent methyltransferase [Thermoguttaceae bacterium]